MKHMLIAAILAIAATALAHTTDAQQKWIDMTSTTIVLAVEYDAMKNVTTPTGEQIRSYADKIRDARKARAAFMALGTTSSQVLRVSMEDLKGKLDVR